MDNNLRIHFSSKGIKMSSDYSREVLRMMIMMKEFIGNKSQVSNTVEKSKRVKAEKK
jgi:hypothetical protein